MRVYSWLADIVSDKSDECRNQFMEIRPIGHSGHCANCCTISLQSGSRSRAISTPLQGLVPPPSGNSLMPSQLRLSAKDTALLL
jgi:hypothetical protein